MPHTLIYSGVCCHTIENREMVKMWARLTRHLNPETKIVIYDSLSPFDPSNFIDRSLNIEIIKFGSNPGHLSQGGKDGAGRTFCEGINLGFDRGFDYAVHLESDMLLARPLSSLITKMRRSKVSAAACFLPQYQFFEFGICAMDVERMAQTEFVKRYDWENAPPWPIPERRIPELFGDDLWIIPWFGTRNDQNQVNPYALNGAFPYAAPDWITHCNQQLAASFLAAHDLGHLA